MQSKTAYVCGFIFNPTYDRVLLIRKNKPEWQKGHLNGIGGKIEINESVEDAMIRECYEESGLKIHQWEYLTELSGDDWILHFWHARTAFFDDAISMTDEKLEYYNAKEIPTDAIENLHWLIPLALQKAKECYQ